MDEFQTLTHGPSLFQDYNITCLVSGEKQQQELINIQRAALAAHDIGLEVHAGHGLTYENVKPIAAIECIKELNIGHFLMGEAVFVGLEKAVTHMQTLMHAARIGEDAA